MHLTERTLNSFTQFLSIGFTFLEISSVFITQCKLNIIYFQYPFMLHFYLKGCLRKLDSCLQNQLKTKKPLRQAKRSSSLFKCNARYCVFIELFNHFDDQFHGIFIIVTVQDSCVRVNVARSYTDSKRRYDICRQMD